MSFNGWCISKDFYKMLKDLLPEGKTILELGSGAGTDELLKRWNVVSIEHDASFVSIGRGGGKYKHKYIYAPIVFGAGSLFTDDVGWYDKDAIAKGIHKLKYDLILVDGPNGTFGRGGFVSNIHLFEKVPIAIDDLQNDKYKKIFQILVNKLQFKEHTIVDNVDGKYFGYMK